MNWRERIHSDPAILGGKPVIRGTRISVEIVLEFIAEGASTQEILEAYDHLEVADILAAVAFTHDFLIKEATSAQREAA